MTFTISVLLMILTVMPLVSLLKIRQIAKYLAAFFIIGIAEIVLTGNLLGLFHHLNDKGLWLVVQAITLCISWGIWFFAQRPTLFGFDCIKLNWHQTALGQKIILIILSISIAIGYAVLVYLIITVPPNNNDSMLVHLVRVGYWLQHGSFTPWQSFIERQVFYPYVAQIVVLWTVLFQGTDLLAPFLQFFSVLFTALGIYGITRQIGGTRILAAIVSLFYLTLPQVILQATTTQDDLVVTCFLILGAYFFLSWYSHSFSDKSDLVLASLSWMLAIGVKPTAFYFFIGFMVFLIIALVVKKMSFRSLCQLGIACLLAFLVFSSFAYINNLIHYHNPLGSPDFVTSESGVFEGNLYQKTLINSGRFTYQFFSLDGLPAAMTQGLQNLKVSLAAKLPTFFDISGRFIKDINKPFRLTNIPGINEDYSWFGPVSFLLLVPAFLLGMVYSIRRKDLKVAFLLLIPLFLMLGIGALRPGWDPYQGRYFNPGLALAMPLSIYVLDGKLLSRVYAFLLTALAIIVLCCSVFLNESKPLVTQGYVARVCNLNSLNGFASIAQHICNQDRTLLPILLPKKDIEALNYLEKETYSSSVQYTILSQFPQFVQPHSKIGLVLRNGDWEYPFFGQHLEYQLYPVTDLASLQNAEWLDHDAVNALLIHLDKDQQLALAPGFSLQGQINIHDDGSVWQIYVKKAVANEP